MDVPYEPLPPENPYPSHPHEPTPQQDEPSQQRDLSRYSLTAEAASELFIQAGVPRSLRTVIRYCSNNTLDCIKVDTERNLKYLVARESVDIRIDELKQIASIGHDAPRRDMASQSETVDAPWHDTASHDATSDVNQKIQELTSRVGELEHKNEELINKNRDLEITNRFKDYAIKKNEGMLSLAQDKLMRFSRVVGELATVMRLKAPTEDTSKIIAYLDAPTEVTDQQDENLVDAPSQPLR